MFAEQTMQNTNNAKYLDRALSQVTTHTVHSTVPATTSLAGGDLQGHPSSNSTSVYKNLRKLSGRTDNSFVECPSEEVSFNLVTTVTCAWGGWGVGYYVKGPVESDSLGEEDNWDTFLSLRVHSIGFTHWLFWPCGCKRRYTVEIR